MQHLPRALATLLVAALAFLWLRTQTPEPRDRTDELEWTSLSVATVRQARGGEPPGAFEDKIAGRLNDNPWRQGIQGTTFGWPYPGMLKTLWGHLADPVAPEHISPTLFRKYQGNTPGFPTVLEADWAPARERLRTSVRACTAICAAALFWIAWNALGPMTGLLAAILFLGTPTILKWSYYARLDLPLLAVLLSVLLGSQVLLRDLRGSAGTLRHLLACLGIGLLAGAAVGIKLNGGLASIFCALVLGSYALGAGLRSRRARGKADGANASSTGTPFGVHLLGALIGGLAAVTLFLYTTPYVHANPLDNVREILEFWNKHMAFQVDRAEGQGIAVARTRMESLELSRSVLFDDGEFFQGRLGVSIGAWIASMGAALLALFALLPVGRWLPDFGCRGAALLTLAWIATVGLGSALWMPVDWERYRFPMIAALVLCQAALIGLPLDLGLRRWRRSRASTDSPPN